MAKNTFVRHKKAWIPVVVTSLALVFAGGPRDPIGDGTYYRWNPDQPVKFTIDQGNLGGLSNAEAAQLVRDAIQVWENINSATLTFSDEGFLSQDITVNNYRSYFGIGSGESPVRPENPIVFDNNGEITNDLFGFGANRSVLGFAGPRFFDPPNREIISAWAVLNGVTATRSEFSRVVRHELGHLLGLDHGQGFQENADQSFSWGLAVPLMYPFMLSRGPEGPITDDIAWFSWMYPNENFQTETGSIKGSVFRRSGAPFQGANVVAMPAIENTDGSYRVDRNKATSVVSDFLWQSNGDYELPGLVPGKYLVLIEPIQPEFTGPSGVGPFDYRPTNFPVDYYDENESFDEDPTVSTVVEVFAGMATTGIDLIANEVVNDLASLGDDDEMLYEFPEGFSFPFFGKVYTDVVVNSDGNLTFGLGDGKVGDPRTESRFLSGPPRIAPLFSDLDPSVVAESAGIKAEIGVDFVKFIWDQVPEFFDPPRLRTNTFSVTLFSSGDILFDYQEINLTPDPSDIYPEGLLSIVGVTAGNQESGETIDLSTASDLTMNSLSLYEVFPGANFDLTGSQIRFIASSTEYYFPVLTGDSSHFTGFAVTNYGDIDLVSTFENLGEDGTLKGGPSNFSIPKDNQLARLGFELFDFQGTDVRDGWVRLSSDQPRIAGFFQIGDAVDKLDGAVADFEQHEILYFTRLYEGPAVFPTRAGFKDAVTKIAIANPNETSIDLTITLYAPTANELVSVQETLAPFGSLYKSLQELLGSDFIPLANGFLKVVVDGPGAVGFQFIELEGTVFGLNAAVDHDQSVLYSGQLGHGNGFFTSLKLVNPTDSFVTIGVTAFVQQNNSISPITKTFSLSGNQSFQETVDALFGLPQIPADTIVGSIRIETTEPGIVGDVVFGDPENARYAAALPLQTRLFTRAIHSQVSNGIHPSDPGLDSFTGLALFNPGDTKATVTIQVYDQDGLLVGETQIELESQERISQILSILVPETAGLVRGSVLLTSDQPMVAQELFGNADLYYLSAVPPTIIE